MRTKTIHDEYLAMKEKSSRINCLVTETDFSTYYPSRNRIDRTIREMSQYLYQEKRGTYYES